MLLANSKLNVKMSYFLDHAASAAIWLVDACLIGLIVINNNETDKV